MSSVKDNKPLRDLIAEAKAEVTEEIEDQKEEEEEEETEAHLVGKHILKSVMRETVIFAPYILKTLHFHTLTGQFFSV